MSTIPDMTWLDHVQPKRKSSLGHLATLACWIEATAPKAGNVHPSASFHNMTYRDFYESALAIGKVFDCAEFRTIGQLILESRLATMKVTEVNTNLGTTLLFGPIARAMVRSRSVSELDTENLRAALRELQPMDAEQIYQAIRLANPGGLGQVPKLDIRDDAPADVMEAMSHAASRDWIAAEYVEVFPKTLALAEHFENDRSLGASWFQTVCRRQCWALAHWGDSLIIRRNGRELDRQVRTLAMEAWSALPDEVRFEAAYRKLDAFLREDGHQRNPGTTADLLAGGLFIALWRLSEQSDRTD